MEYKDLNVRPETIKLLEENRGGKKLLDICLSSDFFFFLIWHQKHKQHKEQGLYQTKSSVQQRKWSTKWQNKKAAYEMGEDICKLYISDKE